MTDTPSIDAAPETGGAAEPLDPAFVALLCCPVCVERPSLRLVRENDRETELACDRCGRVYPITDGFPDLRPESGTLPETKAAPGAPE